MKILLVVIALITVYWIARTLLRSSNQYRKTTPPQSQRMLSCDHCGLHIPESEAVTDGNHHYCCTEHRDLGAS